MVRAAPCVQGGPGSHVSLTLTHPRNTNPSATRKRNNPNP
jgi:hypothetical protein